MEWRIDQTNPPLPRTKVGSVASHFIHSDWLRQVRLEVAWQIVNFRWWPDSQLVPTTTTTTTTTTSSEMCFWSASSFLSRGSVRNFFLFYLEPPSGLRAMWSEQREKKNTCKGTMSHSHAQTKRPRKGRSSVAVELTSSVFVFCFLRLLLWATNDIFSWALRKF